MEKKVAIIGFGVMGRAIAEALRKNDKNIKISVIRRNGDLKSLKDADFIILAVKPKDIEEVSGQIKNKINKNSIIVSILAGIQIKTIYRLLGTNSIVRMMPNLGLSVGAGIGVWKMDKRFPKKAIIPTKRFLNLICENMEAENEEMIDAVTAISGSGPAYFFLLADAMLQSAKKLRLNSEISNRLVSQTLLASALLSKNANYEELIAKIASKGGTTEATLQVFKKENFRDIVARAINAAHKKAIQISKKNE